SATVYVAGAIEDGSFTEDQAELLTKALTEAGVTHTVEYYPAHHGFAVPDNGTYDEAAAARHYEAMDALDRTTLEPGSGCRMLRTASASVLLLTDLQERLVPALHDGPAVVARAARLAEAARMLDVPVRATEQYPAGLGPTVEELAGYPEVVLA